MERDIINEAFSQEEAEKVSGHISPSYPVKVVYPVWLSNGKISCKVETVTSPSGKAQTNLVEHRGTIENRWHVYWEATEIGSAGLGANFYDFLTGKNERFSLPGTYVCNNGSHNMGVAVTAMFVACSKWFQDRFPHLVDNSFVQEMDALLSNSKGGGFWSNSQEKIEVVEKPEKSLVLPVIAQKDGKLVVWGLTNREAKLCIHGAEIDIETSVDVWNSMVQDVIEKSQNLKIKADNAYFGAPKGFCNMVGGIEEPLSKGENTNTRAYGISGCKVSPELQQELIEKMPKVRIFEDYFLVVYPNHREMQDLLDKELAQDWFSATRYNGKNPVTFSSAISGWSVRPILKVTKGSQKAKSWHTVCEFPEIEWQRLIQLVAELNDGVPNTGFLYQCFVERAIYQSDKGRDGFKGHTCQTYLGLVRDVVGGKSVDLQRYFFDLLFDYLNSYSQNDVGNQVWKAQSLLEKLKRLNPNDERKNQMKEEDILRSVGLEKSVFIKADGAYDSFWIRLTKYADCIGYINGYQDQLNGFLAGMVLSYCQYLVKQEGFNMDLLCGQKLSRIRGSNFDELVHRSLERKETGWLSKYQICEKQGVDTNSKKFTTGLIMGYYSKLQKNNEEGKESNDEE